MCPVKKHYLFQPSTRTFYAAQIEDHGIPYAQQVLEAYGPLPEELLLANHLLAWDFPEDLRLADPGWMTNEIAAQWNDLCHFDTPETYTDGWFKKGWIRGRAYGRKKPDASLDEMNERSMSLAGSATAHLSEQTWEGPWTEHCHGFFNGFWLETGRDVGSET